MAGTDNLTRLAGNLSLEERHSLLEKLSNQSTLESGTLYFEEPDHKQIKSFKQQYDALPWYSKFLYFLQSLFGGKSPVSAFEDKLIIELGKKIELASPGLYDCQNSRLLYPFHVHLNRLKEAARFFFDALEAGFDRDKGNFYAFLGSLVMPDVHKKIISGSDAASVMQKFPDSNDTELHRHCFDGMENALQDLTEDNRTSMYQSARSLLCLKQLSTFLFDRMLLAFSHDHTDGQSCPVHSVKDQLISLNNIMYSLKTVPSMTLLESLFVFLAQERAGEPGFEINREVHILLGKAESSLSSIIDFNKHIPLTRVIRCGVRDMTIIPREIPGGEDWFVSYREHWKKFVDSHFSDFVRSRRQNDLIKIFNDFFKGKQLKSMMNAVSDTNPDGFPVKGAFGLSFLLTFYTEIFINHLNVLMRPILIDGEFKSKEQEMEFAEAYNEFMKLESEILELDKKIGKKGDYGERLALAYREIAALPVKKRKIQIVIEEASSESLGIIEGIKRASRSLVEVFTGITAKNEQGGNSDSLSNLEKLSSGKGTAFLDGLHDSMDKFQNVIRILDDIGVMEAG